MDVLSSGITAFDSYLKGGLHFGSTSEWGAPWGQGGRELIRSFVAHASQYENTLTLWVSNLDPTYVVYPPSWFAHGVNLSKVYFARSSHPVTQLKPVFMTPLFKLIVLDAPQHLSRDDWAFLARQVRKNGQILMVIRNTWLSAYQGNVWAKMRLNCWRTYTAPDSPLYTVNAIRGLCPPRLSFVLPPRLFHAA